MARWLVPGSVLLSLLTGSPVRRPADLPPILANDNTRPAGRLHQGVLTLRLEVARGRWAPDADSGPSVPVLAVRQAGGPLQIPSPLIRVPEGTAIRLSVRNTLADSAVVFRGLQRRPGDPRDSVRVEPGATRELRFDAGTPGTYFYWASTTGSSIADRDGVDSQLSGGFIVDSAGGAPADRVFLMGIFTRPADTSTGAPALEVMTINGKSWPHTERLTLPQGDSVRWRWINPTASSHPMHLHGFYYAVHARGGWAADTAYPAPLHPLVVTDLMLPGRTMDMAWRPTQPGNWVFHCHFAFHITPDVTLTGGLAASDRAHSAGGPAVHGMGGLVLGIRVTPRGPTAATPPALEPRRLRLLVQQRAGRFGPATGYGYVMREGAAEPARDSIRAPGPPLILERGQRTAITVVNHLSEPTAVHWHGIELESWADGVPDWSGIAPQTTPPIAPGDSFTAIFTPPRAGTFIYHTHANEVAQISQGLYGPLLVLEPGRRFDPDEDHLVLVSLDGPSTDSAGGWVNGSKSPEPVDLAPDRPHRLRLINIDTDHRVRFRLLRDTVVATWRPVAKDGADLPPAQATVRPATLLTGPGETADMEIVPQPGERLTLEVSAPYFTRPWTVQLPFRVRAGP